LFHRRGIYYQLPIGLKISNSIVLKVNHSTGQKVSSSLFILSPASQSRWKPLSLAKMATLASIAANLHFFHWLAKQIQLE
jgi:hypothetical protein